MASFKELVTVLNADATFSYNENTGNCATPCILSEGFATKLDLEEDFAMNSLDHNGIGLFISESHLSESFDSRIKELKIDPANQRDFNVIFEGFKGDKMVSGEIGVQQHKHYEYVGLYYEG